MLTQAPRNHSSFPGRNFPTELSATNLVNLKEPIIKEWRKSNKNNETKTKQKKRSGMIRAVFFFSKWVACYIDYIRIWEWDDVHWLLSPETIERLEYKTPRSRSRRKKSCRMVRKDNPEIRRCDIIPIFPSIICDNKMPHAPSRDGHENPLATRRRN